MNLAQVAREFWRISCVESGKSGAHLSQGYSGLILRDLEGKKELGDISILITVKHQTINRYVSVKRKILRS